jgi:GntR family transcriptional regulator
VRRLVAAGTLVPGSAVPSVRDLAKALRVNPATVVRAYQDLVASGVLEVQRGAGTFVAAIDTERIADHRRLELETAAARYVRLVRSLGGGVDEAIEAVRATCERSGAPDSVEDRKTGGPGGRR